MLLRKAGYTGGIYREQYEGKMPNIFPSIEFVLYWGIPRWKDMRIVVDFLAEGASYRSNRKIVHTSALIPRMLASGLLTKMIKMVQMLMADGRIDDLRRVVSDQSYRERLYVEAGLL